LKQDFENQIKMKEVVTKYEKLFEQNLEKQLLVNEKFSIIKKNSIFS